LGVRVVTDPAARNTLVSTGTFGWSGAFNTHFFIDPVERIIGIFMTQSAFLESRWQLRDDFATAVMQALVDGAGSGDYRTGTCQPAAPCGAPNAGRRRLSSLVVPAASRALHAAPDHLGAATRFRG